MVAYDFKPRFVPLIEAGLKAQTIRAPRAKPHAQPGDVLQLYTGMRTKACRLIRTAVCTQVQCIELSFTDDCITVSTSATALAFAGRAADRFARLDGFVDWADMRAFWKAEHGDEDFAGVLIRWLP